MLIDFKQVQLFHQYKKIRDLTAAICHPLETEDYVVQPSPEVSPPKWHLAHTTWFFEYMVLRSFKDKYRPYHHDFAKLFNSYYKSAGDHWIQAQRGHLSRPTVKEIYAYRAHVDQAMEELLERSTLSAEALDIILTGLHHEQQHQELLYMDIKAILAVNPGAPRYAKEKTPRAVSPQKDWHALPEGLFSIGIDTDASFSFDNERPRHTHFFHAAEIRQSLITNAEYREFILDGGYQRHQLWLSLGWDWVNRNQITKPLYWREREGQHYEFTLYGESELDPHAPVTHLSYYEAWAYAKWSSCRLPLEGEMERFEANHLHEISQSDQTVLQPNDASAPFGQVWCWTNEHYSPYPGFQSFKGGLGEYNGKFMCGQFVLRGGCVATPKNHYRRTYRNFYLPEQRWMFSGLRLAKDLR